MSEHRDSRLLPLLRLHGVVQNYQWGSVTALAELLGRQPSGKPEAELWIGAHPAAPSEVELGGRRIPLNELVALRPMEVLGEETVGRIGPAFPFLLKILAAAKPLSIQAHPNGAQAAAGFLREEEAGVPVDAPTRSYRDPNPKDEIVCALDRPFPLLAGFRPRERSIELLRALETVELEPLLELLGGGDTSSGTRRFSVALMERFSPKERASGVSLTESVAEAARPLRGPAFRWVERLCRHFPGDPMALSPLFLNLVELEPGQALVTGSGTLHSYLGGVAVELMTNSDNVLRAGLTSKHVDAEELWRILRFEASEPEVLEGAGTRQRRVYTTPGLGLVLERIEVKSELTVERSAGHPPEILLCTSGAARATSHRDPPIELAAGEALLVPAPLGCYHVAGDGTLFRAHVSF